MGHRIASGISKDNDVISLVADTTADIANIGTAYPAGSIIYITGTTADSADAGAVYMLNNQKEWVVQP